jgi:rod shape-determining protein MreB and related proteins
MRFLRGILRSTVYVRVLPNRFLLRHIESGRTSAVDAQEAFTTRRNLVGEFGPAVDALERGFKELRLGIRYFSDPVAVMHPIAMVDGGLSGIEYRILFEIAEGAGAKRAEVWVGSELSDDQVRDKARAA